MVPYIVELRGLWFDTVVIIDGLKLLSMSNTSVILNRAIVCFYTVKLNGDFPRSMSYRDMWDKYSNTAFTLQATGLCNIEEKNSQNVFGNIQIWQNSFSESHQLIAKVGTMNYAVMR